ncbi:hypothetical protein [Natronorubrum sp. DTA7]|uniref:hypothetical protein n=1 Tax=Natronorubrum sp. DTA7 TaxID=3447016 RepID=UPI003F85F194
MNGIEQIQPFVRSLQRRVGVDVLERQRNELNGLVCELFVNHWPTLSIPFVLHRVLHLDRGRDGRFGVGNILEINGRTEPIICLQNGENDVGINVHAFSPADPRYPVRQFSTFVRAVVSVVLRVQPAVRHIAAHRIVNRTFLP